ncbi:MAG: preprotein translocase subunit SecG [Candidatus Binatia bacterium]
MTTILVITHVAACIVLILAVLLQAGRGADMGAAFGGASSPMFGSGSAANPLARLTTITAIAFLTTALFLAVASARRASVFDSMPEPLAATPQAESSAPLSPPPAAPLAEAQPLTIPATPAPGDGAAAPEAAPADAAPAAETAPVPAPAAEAAPSPAAEKAPAAEVAPAPEPAAPADAAPAAAAPEGSAPAPEAAPAASPAGQ